MAKDIFGGIKNSSSLSSDGSGADTADIGASIGIIGVMANASVNVVLDETVFPVRPFTVDIIQFQCKTLL